MLLWDLARLGGKCKNNNKRKKTFQRIETIQYQIKKKYLQHLNNFIPCLIHYGIEHGNLHKIRGSTAPVKKKLLSDAIDNNQN